MIVQLLGFFRMRWAMAYLTSQKEYLGSKWLEHEIVRKGL